MKIKINRSVEKQLRPLLSQIEEQDIWYPLYNDGGEPIFNGRNKSHEFYADLGHFVSFEGKTVIDLGCNLGHYCFLAARLGAIRVVGVDINDNLIQACNILRDFQGLDQVEFHTSDFLTSAPDKGYDLVLLIDYIGKNVIKNFKLKQALAAAECRSRGEILFTFHHAYTLSDKLKTTKKNLLPYYPTKVIRNGKFRLLDYVKQYFSGKGRLTAFNPKGSDGFRLKQPVHFVRTGAAQGQVD